MDAAKQWEDEEGRYKQLQSDLLEMEGQLQRDQKLQERVRVANTELELDLLLWVVPLDLHRFMDSLLC